jgi:hypothetical protein
MGAHALVGITYAAGDTMLTALDGDMYGNRWRDARPDVSGKAGNVTRWITMV